MTQLLYIWTRVWVLGTQNAGWKFLFYLLMLKSWKRRKSKKCYSINTQKTATLHRCQCPHLQEVTSKHWGYNIDCILCLMNIVVCKNVQRWHPATRIEVKQMCTMWRGASKTAIFVLRSGLGEIYMTSLMISKPPGLFDSIMKN